MILGQLGVAEHTRQKSELLSLIARVGNPFVKLVTDDGSYIIFGGHCLIPTRVLDTVDQLPCSFGPSG
jgi:hypothetical protein